MIVTQKLHTPRIPSASTVLELLKPVTWFPPMWAYACGVVSTGVSILDNWHLFVIGLVLCGPIVCGMSQAANDWCDRHVDAINEPDRPIPSGRMPGRWGLWIAILMSVGSLAIAAGLGVWGFVATLVGVIAAWAYSAEPVRMKKSGWVGPGLVGLCYEGLPWFTGAAVMTQTLPNANIILLATLYAIGAHGIMTLNDFKALEGDHATGVRSLPVTLGPQRAAWVACGVMLAPQLAVVAFWLNSGSAWMAAIISALVAAQLLAMRRLIQDPKKYAPWYNATGVLMFVSGMMVCAIGLRGI